MNCNNKAPGVRCQVLVMLAVAAAMFVIVLPTSALAQRGGDSFHSRINPTPEQKEKLQAYKRDSREKTRQLSSDLRSARKDLFTQLRNYKLDQRKAIDTAQRVGDLQKDLLNAKLDNQIALRRILTSEQFDRLRSAVRGMGVEHEGLGRSRGDKDFTGSVSELGLSKNQQDRIKLLFQKSAASGSTLMNQLTNDSQELRKLYMSYNLDQKHARSLISSIANTRSQMLKSMVARQQQLRSILSEQQFNALVKTMRPPRDRHHEGEQD